MPNNPEDLLLLYTLVGFGIVFYCFLSYGFNIYFGFYIYFFYGTDSIEAVFF